MGTHSEAEIAALTERLDVLINNLVVDMEDLGDFWSDIGSPNVAKTLWQVADVARSGRELIIDQMRRQASK